MDILPAGNGWFLFLGSDPHGSLEEVRFPWVFPWGVRYCTVEVLTGRLKDCVINCLIFGSVLSCGMEVEMLYRTTGLFTQKWLLSGRLHAESGVSDVTQNDSGGIAMTTSVRLWGGDSEPYDWPHVLSKGAGLMVPPIGRGLYTVDRCVLVCGDIVYLVCVHLAGISWGPPNYRVMTPCRVK